MVVVGVFQFNLNRDLGQAQCLIIFLKSTLNVNYSLFMPCCRSCMYVAHYVGDVIEEKTQF